jgi:hypothetical protein
MGLALKQFSRPFPSLREDPMLSLGYRLKAAACARPKGASSQDLDREVDYATGAFWLPTGFLLLAN